MPNDAVNKQPTLDEQMSQFKSLATVDGAVATDDGDTPGERKEPNLAKQPPEEKDDTSAIAEKPEITEKTENDPSKAKPAKPGRTTADRIGELTRNWRQAQRDSEAKDAELRDMRDRLARIERGELTPGSGGAKTQRNDTDGPPDPADPKYQYGELDVRYIEDRTRYAVRQELKTDREKSSQEQEQKQQREAAARKAQEFTERKSALEEKGAAEFPDFTEVVFDDDVPFSTTMGELIFGSDVGHKIAYQLASDPKEARRVFGLTDTQQAAYFGRLEAQLSSPADATTRKVKVPKASPPPENRARGGGGATPEDDDSEDFAAFEAKWRRAQSR